MFVVFKSLVFDWCLLSSVKGCKVLCKGLGTVLLCSTVPKYRTLAEATYYVHRMRYYSTAKKYFELRNDGGPTPPSFNEETRSERALEERKTRKIHPSSSVSDSTSSGKPNTE